MQYRALIIDDEPLAVRELERLLAAHGEVSVEGYAYDPVQARRLFAQMQIDLVFLDVHLGPVSGFVLVPDIPPGAHLIMVTASDQHAMDAYNASAVDYLLKPVEPQRLAACLDKVQRIQPEVLGADKEAAENSLTRTGKLLLKSGTEQRVIHPFQIQAITANGEYSDVHVAGESPMMVRKALKMWEEDLRPDLFIRIHRTAIINLDFLRRAQVLPGGRFEVYLKDCPEPFVASRRASNRLKEVLMRRLPDSVA